MKSTTPLDTVNAPPRGADFRERLAGAHPREEALKILWDATRSDALAFRDFVAALELVEESRRTVRRLEGGVW